jgi:hypothetical protein
MDIKKLELIQKELSAKFAKSEITEDQFNEGIENLKWIYNIFYTK